MMPPTSLDIVWPRRRGFTEADHEQLTEEQVNHLEDERYSGNLAWYEWIDDQFELSGADQERKELRQIIDFCWKSCAVYATAELLRPHRYALFQFIESKWFRGEKTRVQWGSHFGKLIDCHNPGGPRTIPEIAEVHRQLCDQVQKMVVEEQYALVRATRHPRVRLRYQENKISTYMVRPRYCLLPIFRSLFIVIDHVWHVGDADKTNPLHAEDAYLVFTNDSPTLSVSIEEVCSDKDVHRTGNILSGRIGTLIDIVIALDEKQEGPTPSWQEV